MAIPSFLEYINNYKGSGVDKHNCNIDFFYKIYLEHVIEEIKQNKSADEYVSIQDMLTQIYFIAAFVQYHAKLEVEVGLITLTALSDDTIQGIKNDILHKKGDVYLAVKTFVTNYHKGYYETFNTTKGTPVDARLGILSGLISTALIGASFAPGISQAGFIASCFFGALFAAAALLFVERVVASCMLWKAYYLKQEGRLEAGTAYILASMTENATMQASMQQAVKSTLESNSTDACTSDNHTTFANNNYYAWMKTGEPHTEVDMKPYETYAPSILRCLNRL